MHIQRNAHGDTRVIPIPRYRYVYQIPQPAPAQTLREMFPIAAVEYIAGFLLLVGLALRKDEELDYVIRCLDVVMELRTSGSLE